MIKGVVVVFGVIIIVGAIAAAIVFGAMWIDSIQYHWRRRQQRRADEALRDLKERQEGNP